MKSLFVDKTDVLIYEKLQIPIKNSMSVVIKHIQSSNQVEQTFLTNAYSNIADDNDNQII